MQKSFILTLPGLTIAGKTWGEAHLPPLLALHGWLDNANSFDLIAPYLAKQFHVIAIDLPGHGHSSHLPAGSHYHFSDGAFTVLQVIKALNYQQIHLLGHSMGACLASIVAGIAPEQILSLALIEGLGPLTYPAQTCRKQLAYYAQATLNSGSKPAKAYPSLLMAAQARAKRGYLSLEHSEILCHRGLEEKEGLFYWRHDKRLLPPTPLRMTEEQVLSCLEGIQAKSCLLWATEGFGAFSDHDMETRINTVPHLTIYNLKGGHHIHMEKPGAVAGHLEEFYSS